MCELRMIRRQAVCIHLSAYNMMETHGEKLHQIEFSAVCNAHFTGTHKCSFFFQCRARYQDTRAHQCKSTARRPSLTVTRISHRVILHMSYVPTLNSRTSKTRKKTDKGWAPTLCLLPCTILARPRCVSSYFSRDKKMSRDREVDKYFIHDAHRVSIS